MGSTNKFWVALSSAVAGIAFIFTIGSAILDRGTAEGVVKEKIAKLESKVEEVSKTLHSIEKTVVSIQSSIQYFHRDIRR